MASDNVPLEAGCVVVGELMYSIEQHIWWQALNRNLTLILVHVCLAHYYIYPSVHTALSHCILVLISFDKLKLMLAEMSKQETSSLLEAFFEKEERANGETAEDS